MNDKSENRICHNCKGEFLIEPDDFSFYEKMKVLVPNRCPDCRFKMRALFRNETTLYSRTCFETQKNIISVYNPNSPYKVVSVEYYSSDSWDPRLFGIDYDYSKTFFSQFDALLKRVYKKGLNPVLSVGPIINSDYVNFAGGCKDSYFCFNTVNVENVMYSKGVYDSKDSSDLYYGKNLENCYECVDVHKSNHVMYGKNSTNCLDCILIEDCRNCSNCFGCVNLRNKSYCWFNEQVTKEEYTKKLSEFLGSFKNHEEQIDNFNNFRVKFPKRLNQNINTINSTGDYLLNTKNTKNSFEGGDMEDCHYVYASSYAKNCNSITAGLYGQDSLEVVSLNKSTNIIASFLIENSQNIEYSYALNNCKDCMGCDSLRNAQYCILNKEYSKEEYEKIKQHIVKELTELEWYGLMIPPELAPFAYNETIAQDNMPLTKEEALALGFRWEDNVQVTKGKETILPEQIPDHTKDIHDSVTEEILLCTQCERNYKITKQELLFYKKMSLPIPRKCFYCRHQNRIQSRGPYKLWHRACMCNKKNHFHGEEKCIIEFETSYAPDQPEIIYCEKCYQQEVL